MEKTLTLSVHQLVDFLLRSGDIDNRVFNRSSMTEGSRLHTVYQSQQGSDYLSEYLLQHRFVVGGVDITLQGRADGILKRKNGEYMIDEIKTTVEELEIFRNDNFEWHIGQAKCYAYLFALEQNLDSIGVRLTYIRQGKEKEKRIEDYFFLRSELESYVYALFEDYLAFYNIIFRHIEKKNETIEDLTFPFEKYRRGQRELTKYCYAIAKNGGRFFAEAPTGIGKTMSTLFPYIKASIDDSETKIFYLTAKTSGKEAAYNAIELLKAQGLELNDIVITAKDKVCFCKGCACNPDECPYAKGYYNKIQGVLNYSLMNYTTFVLETITQIAKENEICPFEFELDLSLFCDVIICDYNYMFDPISYMKRYFDEDASHHLALVDEAHNLIDRSRDMYSSTITYQSFLDARKSVRHSKHVRLKRALAKLKKLFDSLTEGLEPGQHILDDYPDELYSVLNYFIETCQDINKNEHQEMTKELLDFYLDVNEFFKLSDFYGDKYILYLDVLADSVNIRLLCLDASSYIARTLRQIKGATLFSATLQPIEYYIDTLGGDKANDPRIILPSPFPINNLRILVAPKVSVRWKDRDKTYKEVGEYIKHFIKNKVGNYFIYSPSYEYMDHLLENIDLEDVDVFVQTKDMREEEREAFLLNFMPSPERTTLGFMVIGGAFSEGIDLVSDRLIGAVIIGIGMPRINFESDKIAEFYDSRDLPGRDYAYLNPGMNKVMQAVGRVIRSEKDRGAVLLIDERYTWRQYQDLFRAEWKNYQVVLTPEEVEENLAKFFKN